jgi:hypothetical protein
MSWSNRVAVTFRSVKIAEWVVHGEKKEDAVCDLVSASAGWRDFLQWREGVPKRDWDSIVISQTLTTDKK